MSHDAAIGAYTLTKPKTEFNPIANKCSSRKHRARQPPTMVAAYGPPSTFSMRRRVTRRARMIGISIFRNILSSGHPTPHPKNVGGGLSAATMVAFLDDVQICVKSSVHRTRSLSRKKTTKGADLRIRTELVLPTYVDLAKSYVRAHVHAPLVASRSDRDYAIANCLPLMVSQGKPPLAP